MRRHSALIIPVQLRPSIVLPASSAKPVISKLPRIYSNEPSPSARECLARNTLSRSVSVVAMHSTCSTSGCAAEALPLTQAALATQEAVSGPDHSWTKGSDRPNRINFPHAVVEGRVPWHLRRTVWDQNPALRSDGARSARADMHTRRAVISLLLQKICNVEFRLADPAYWLQAASHVIRIRPTDS